MNPRTQLVMNRHRELKAEGLTGLEASRVVLREAEEGTLGVTKVVPTLDVPTNCPYTAPVEEFRVCECGKPREGRYKSCSACRKRAQRGK